MILYVGVSGVPESLIPLEFDSIEEARDFSNDIAKRYMETETKLFMAIEVEDIYKERSKSCRK